jgi:tripartite ATP-independent transporter DctP family solute receptor
MKKWKAFLGIMAISAALLVSGCGGKSSSSQGGGNEPTTLKLGLTFADKHMLTQELYKMAENVNKRTEGKIKIEIYADSLLGKEAEMYEQLHMGTIDMALETIAFMSTSHPEFTIEDLPYMFKERKNGYEALDGDYGKKINEIIASDGTIKNLGFMELGYRHMTNNVRPITKPEDMKDIKFRTTTSDLRRAVFEALGAQPISMSFSEVFTGLQQGVIDGQESPLATIASSSFNEVQKYLSLTGHFWTNECLLVNQKKFSSLTEEQQKIIQEEAKAAEKRIREKNVETDKKLVKELQDKGMKVNEVDKAAFVKQLQPLYDEWGKKIGPELMDAYKKYSGY